MAHIHIGEDRIYIRRLAEDFQYIFAQLRHYRMINRLISEKIYLYLINLLIYVIRISICTDEFKKKKPYAKQKNSFSLTLPDWLTNPNFIVFLITTTFFG